MTAACACCVAARVSCRLPRPPPHCRRERGVVFFCARTTTLPSPGKASFAKGCPSCNVSMMTVEHLSAECMRRVRGDHGQCMRFQTTTREIKRQDLVPLGRGKGVQAAESGACIHPSAIWTRQTSVIWTRHRSQSSDSMHDHDDESLVLHAG